MTRTLTLLVRAVALVVLLFACVPQRAQQPASMVEVHPQDNGAVLSNPGMGWMLYQYDNELHSYESKLAPSDALPEFQGVTVAYMRLAWSYIEPQDGKYNWALIDGPMQKWIQAGKKVAFRFTESEGAPNGRGFGGYATPRWVEQEGAHGCHLRVAAINPRGSTIAKIERAANGDIWEPDFNDPVFLAKLDQFLAAAAARYDGNPHVAFVDVAFGVWGEGHTFCGDYDAATIERHIDLYRKNFKHTLLMVNDNTLEQGRGFSILTYAAEHGLGLRDDSILVLGGEKANFNAYKLHDPDASFAKVFWPTLPVALETEHYRLGKVRDNWDGGKLFLKAIEDFHASYASIHGDAREFLAENQALIQRIDMRLGYRLVLRQMSWPSEVISGGTLPVEYEWANAGVAPCLPGGYPAITLEDANGGIASVFVDNGFNIRGLPVARPGQVTPLGRGVAKGFLAPIEFALPPPVVLRAGHYGLYISIGDASGTPTISLPLAGTDGHGRYRVGEITVLPAGQDVMNYY